MIETVPNGEKEEYKIEDNGYSKKQSRGNLVSWALSDFGRITCYLSLPQYKE